MEYILETSNLTKIYGDHAAVRNLSFKLVNGRIYGLLGPNGAGKSTTMNMMTGCLAPTYGTVSINGYDIYEQPLDAKRFIGYLPEQPPLYTDMTPEEYLKWSEKKSFWNHFKTRNDSLFVSKGKEKFDFTDMHFDLGPAEKIFGPGGVQIKTKGSAELKFGYNYKFTDNPSLSERNRTVKGFEFDQKINLSVNAKVGTQMDFNLNYNTDATFEMDAKNLKLSYEGKEDEIVKLLEAGNVEFPTNSSLIRGSNSLFGIRSDLQFGRLRLQTVVSQKKTKSKSVGSKGGAQLTTFDIQAYEYDENRHFFLAHYFHDTYDRACSTLPNITSGITINRIDRHHRVVHLREFLHLVVVHIQRPQTCSCSSSVCMSVIV